MRTVDVPVLTDIKTSALGELFLPQVLERLIGLHILVRGPFTITEEAMESEGRRIGRIVAHHDTHKMLFTLDVEEV